MGVTELEQRRELAELQRQETELTPRGPLTAPAGAETAAAAGALGLLAAAARVDVRARTRLWRSSFALFPVCCSRLFALVRAGSVKFTLVHPSSP